MIFSGISSRTGTLRLKHQSDSLHHRIDSLNDLHYANARKSTVFFLNRQLDTAFRDENRALFADSQYLEWDTPEQEALGIKKAAENAARFNSEINTYKFNVYEEEYYVHHDDIELLKKFAQALACFILFFIGAPIGALVRKGGLGTGAIVSVLFFVLYWVVDISGVKLASNGAIEAPIGAFASSMVLIPIGVFLTWCAINDSDMFNMDQIKVKWRKLKSKVSRFFKPVRIVYMGTPEFAVEQLRRLVEKGHEICGVFTQPDKPKNRGHKMAFSPVKEYALTQNIPVYQPLKMRDGEALSIVQSLAPELIVVAAYGKILPEDILNTPPHGSVNVHSSVLPKYRGAAPINWAILNGDTSTGVTIMYMAKELDAGDIICVKKLEILPDENAQELRGRFCRLHGAEWRQGPSAP